MEDAPEGDAMSAYYSVGKMASLFGLSRPTLIYYDNMGLFRPARVSESGARLYLPTQIPTLRLICLLKDLGIELKRIAEIIDLKRTDQLVYYLSEQRQQVDIQIEELTKRRALIDQRISFQQKIDDWLASEGRPTLRTYERRRVVTEPFGEREVVDRSVLHPTLVRSMRKLRGGERIAPVSGFGTMLTLEGVRSGKPLSGGRTFVVVPDEVNEEELDDVVELPAGIYVCLSYRGMPYDGMGSQKLMSWLSEHRFEPEGDLFDFCLLDTCSYDEEHQEDFCCIQVRIKE
ncbi:MerR family transcriptional regulator [Collinsella vaginalis]|uniref:MerR family transcriptional regulator n=1 Tax=Collinsella vaginalis TaxID=1870987 RepID=UPI0015C4F555|nr:MerR family transcriptional regulator [Collinsella vaginalis]